MTQLVMPPVPARDAFDDRAQRPSPSWIRWFQTLLDLLGRPVNNRATLTINPAFTAASATILSSGQGTAALTPKRYAEFFVSGCVQAASNTDGDGGTLSIYRTTGAIPAAGVAPGGADVKVLSASFSAPAANQGNAIAFAFFDSGLSVNTAYRYYFAASAAAGTATFSSTGKDLQVSEF